MARGRTNDALAAELAFTPKTARDDVSSIFTTLPVPGRAQAIITPCNAGLGT